MYNWNTSITVLFTSCIIGVAAVQADSKCSGNPPMYNGKPCASTTNYVDGHKGACGCGPEGGDAQVIEYPVPSTLYKVSSCGC